MKFAKELEADAVPEWRVKYLNYKAGKKHIKAIVRALNRAANTPSQQRRLDNLFNAPATLFAPRSPTDGALDYEEPDPLQTEVSTPRPGPAAISDERSGLAQTPASRTRYGSFAASDKHDFALPAPALGVPSSGRKGIAKTLDRLGLSLHRITSAQASGVAGPEQTPRGRVHRLFSTGGSTLTRQASSRNDATGMEAVRAAEREFYDFLDDELDKIETFYKEKEDQATERLAVLRAQLHEMRNRRTAEIAEAKRRRKQGRSNAQARTAADGTPVDATDAAEQEKKGGGLDWIGPIKDRLLIKPGPNSKALQKMARTPVMAGQEPQVPIRGLADYVRRAPGDDVPYRTAKRKLKLAMQEFYRSLELLKSYALLNRTAFRKLNKKYDKAVNARPAYRYMNEKVNKSYFVTSDVLDGHLRAVEDLYARYFEKGNHKIAAGKLRNLGVKRTGDQSDSAFRSGVMIGLGAVFAVQGLINGVQLLFDEDRELAEKTGYLLQLYGGYFLILLLFILFTLACRTWTKNRVNYPFIFEFDSRNFLDWKQLAEFPCFFFALFGIVMWLNFSRFGDWEDMYLYYPVVLICISLAILFLPAPILHHKARRWFLYSHWRLLWSGYYPVEFRDFFLGDIWCSLTYATSNVELFFCLYANSFENPAQCNSSHSRLLGFFSALPPIWRVLQCLRRYYDTRNVFPHLANCGKYVMTIFTAVFLSIYRIENNSSTLSHYIAFAAVNAIYCSIWDLFMDFSLLQANARRRLLRDITALRPVWIYYAIMFLDPLLRFSWILYAIFTHNTQHSTLVSFCVALAEVIRRGLWTLLRVENEHCGNVSQYKAARETPLPYKLELASKSGSAQEEGAAAQPAVTTPLVTPSPPTPPPGTAHSQAAFPGQAQPLQGLLSADAAVPPTTAAHLAAPTLEEGGATSTGVAQQAGLGVAFRRHRRTSTAGRRSILQAMAEAHRQDFEKRRPSIAAGSSHSHEEPPAKRVGAVVAAGACTGTATVGVGDYLSAAEEEDEDEVAVEDDEEERGHEAGSITEGIKSDDDDEDEDEEDDGEESEEMREHRTRMRMRMVDGGGGNMD